MPPGLETVNAAVRVMAVTTHAWCTTSALPDSIRGPYFYGGDASLLGSIQFTTQFGGAQGAVMRVGGRVVDLSDEAKLRENSPGLRVGVSSSPAYSWKTTKNSISVSRGKPQEAG
jgi:hypothetical protein